MTKKKEELTNNLGITLYEKVSAETTTRYKINGDPIELDIVVVSDDEKTSFFVKVDEKSEIQLGEVVSTILLLQSRDQTFFEEGNIYINEDFFMSCDNLDQLVEAIKSNDVL